MLRRGLSAPELRGLQNGDAQYVLRCPGERDVLHFRIRNLLVGEYAAVNELFHRVRICPQTCQCPAGVIVRMPDDAQEKVVRADSVTSGPESLLSGVPDNGVQFVRYFYFHLHF